MMKAVLSKITETGKKPFAVVLNSQMNGCTVEQALQEFIRQGGIIKEGEKIAVELREG